jgi:dTDP-D-glucose 4,6-dehydratase
MPALLKALRDIAAALREHTAFMRERTLDEDRLAVEGEERRAARGAEEQQQFLAGMGRVMDEYAQQWNAKSTEREHEREERMLLHQREAEERLEPRWDARMAVTERKLAKVIPEG